MSPSPSPFTHAASVPPHSRAPLPSPSLSPSIASLLSSSTDQPADSNDYFSNNSNPQDVFGPPDGGNSPTPSPLALQQQQQQQTLSSAPAYAFSNLVTPDPQHAPPPPPAPVPSTSRPRSSHKRPRPTSSSSRTSLDGHGFNGNGTGTGSSHDSVTEEQEGAMEPPLSRVRRSSSTSSASTVPPPPPPPSHFPTAQSTSSSAPPSRQGPPAAPTMQRRASDLPLEPSIFNVEPIDEFTREVADWLWGFCALLDWDKVEIEAKIGLLVDQRAGGARVHLPVPIEAILTDDTGLRFQSNMTVNQHKSFNRLLNSRVEESAHPSYPFAAVRYAHTREADTFHEVFTPGQGKRKVRVTKDQKGQRAAKAVEKVRVADMNVYSPKRMFDWRVSVSLENPAPLPDTPPTHTRYKDRISYTHQLFTVDLTQVSSNPPPLPLDPQGRPVGATHELEIEFRNARTLLEEAAKEGRGEENRYLEMVGGLLNNVRMLIRNASDP
ncbi:hypothetical protein JCM8547_007125 [Rhodosporidiobolus lusitaniae]